MMMRTPAVRKPGTPRGGTAVPFSFPAPIGGWNARDPLEAMKPTDAVVLDNFFPGSGSVSLRRGWASHVTGMIGTVESLMEYAPPSGSNKLFAAAGSRIYDATTAGTAGAAVVTGLTNAQWSHVNFASAAVRVLYMANGADTPRYFDGTSWTNSTFTGTGLTLSSLDFVHAHMNRLWFVQKDSCVLWYGPVSAISGTLTKWDLTSLFTRGGKIVALASWTRDGGAGPDDHLVVLTSKGEVALYAGTDPSSSTTSALVGVYKIPEPIGRRCIVRSGADLGVVTSLGVISLAQALAQSESAAKRAAFTDKITLAFQYEYEGTATVFGWQIIEFPKAEMAIVNVPSGYQFVMNTRTGAWCRFLNIQASCWSLFGDRMMFGNSSGVCAFGEALLDNDSVPIQGAMQTAFSAFGSARQKILTLARPRIVSPDGKTPLVVVQSDYDPKYPAITPGSSWPYSANVIPSAKWQSITGSGVALSLAFGVAGQSDITLNGIDARGEVSAVDL